MTFLPDSVPPIFADQGLLPTRGSLVLDLIVCAIGLALAVLAFSIYSVRVRRNYALHRQIQTVLSIVLLIAVVAFEIDVRFLTDWRAAAEKSPFYASGWVDRVLWIHLSFAIPTPFIWGWIFYRAWKGFRPLEPGAHSRFHRRWGWIAASLMALTVVTGWLFYWMAFVAGGSTTAML